MRGDFLNEINPQIKESFLKSIADTVVLIKNKEFEDFELSINYEDAECQDLILKIHNKTPGERENTILEEGHLIIKKYFTYQKKKQLISLLTDIKEKYSKKKKATVNAAYTALLLLEDKLFEAGYLPLLTACLSCELHAMEDELFADPAYFSKRAAECLKQQDFGCAEKFFLLERRIDGERWDSYEGLAEVYFKQGRKEEAIKQMKEALEMIYKCWKENQEYLDFEVVEEVEEKADEILNRDRSGYLKRLCDYARGLLYFLGAAYVDNVIEEIKAISCCRQPFSKEEIVYYLKDTPGIKLDNDLVYLQEIEDHRLIISEVSRRGLKPRSPYSLSALKLAQEGRVKEMFFTEDEYNKDLDADLKYFTDGKLDLVKAYEELRKDVTGQKHFNLIINKFVSERNPRIKEIVEILTYIWSNFPRWEIGGRVPSELSDKRKAEGLSPEPHTFMTSFAPPANTKITPTSGKPKIGRNNSCSCGSGKKYKKCCGR